MRVIAVLGANGQLGKTIKSLANSEEDTYKFYSSSDVDITNSESLSSIFAKHDFDFCINCAAYTNVEGAEKNIDLAFSINAEGVKKVAEFCGKYKVKLIHISTDYVFDGQKKKPYTTSDKPNPINQYGKSKLKGELYIRKIIKEHYIIRTSWLYSLHGKNFLKTITNKIKEKSILKITTEECGTPTSCIDLSLFIFHLIKSKSISFGVYNFSASGYTSWYGFAKEVCNLLLPNHIGNIIPVSSFKTIAKRPKYSVLDISETEKIYKKLEIWQTSLNKLIKD